MPKLLDVEPGRVVKLKGTGTVCRVLEPAFRDTMVLCEFKRRRKREPRSFVADGKRVTIHPIKGTYTLHMDARIPCRRLRRQSL